MDDVEKKQEHAKANNEIYPELHGSAESKMLVDFSETTQATEAEKAGVTGVAGPTVDNPNQPVSDLHRSGEIKAPKVKKNAGWWIFGSILFVFLALALGVWLGYTRGVNR